MPLVEIGKPQAPPPSRWAWLRSQGLGLICGQGTVVLLAIGSIIMVVTGERGGASANIRTDDIRAFFTTPSGWHLWFYLLIGVLVIFAVNTLLATWHSVVTKWRNGVRTLMPYGASVIHVAFLVAMLAHLIGGIWGEELGGAVVGEVWRPLPDGTQARVVAMESDLYPNGQTRKTEVRLEIRDSTGDVRAETVAHNGPVTRGFGSELWLMTRAMQTAVATISDGTRTCAVAAGGLCNLAGKRFAVSDVHLSGHWGNIPVAIISPAGVTPGSAPAMFLMPGQPQNVSEGVALTLTEVRTQPAVMLRGRKAPGNPWALLSSLLLVGGMLMMGRRWL